MGELSKTPAQGTLDFEEEQKDEVEVVAEQETQETQESPEKPKGPSAFSRLWKTLGDMLSDES